MNTEKDVGSSRDLAQEAWLERLQWLGIRVEKVENEA